MYFISPLAQNEEKYAYKLYTQKHIFETGESYSERMVALQY